MNKKRQFTPKEFADAFIREGVENTTTGNGA